MADWLVDMTEAITSLPAHEAVRTANWVVPAVQTVHILAVAIVFSASLIIALRTLGIAGVHWTPARWQHRFGGWTAVALVLLLLSGLVMILAEPERELLNSLFQIKMPLVIIATLWSLALGRRLPHGPVGRPISLAMRLSAIGLFLLWAVIMGLGRWIAYAG